MNKLRKYLGVLLLLLLAAGVSAQKKPADCRIEVDERDPFDSLRTIAAEAINIGYIIPSLYEERKGPKLIEEAKALPMYSGRDSIRAVFLTLLVPEYHFEVAEKGFFVKVLTDSSEVFALYTIPDEGVFDKTTNMRTYQHTCLLPMDIYYKLTYNRIVRIRIKYRDRERDIELSEKQGESLRASLQCVGLAAGLLPRIP